VDTRTKIVSAADAGALARGARDVVVVTGHFDVLLASHAREIAVVREAHPDAILLVALTSPPEPLMEPRARAELVAALAMVDYVVSLEDGEVAGLLAAFEAARIVHLEDAHRQRMRELIEHVHRRQSA
jgi:glycerol-3-phosphate cytidylyltransferase-like family protein